MEEMYERTRPLGITIIAALLGISALLAVVFLILGLTHVSIAGMGAGMTPGTSTILLAALIIGIFEIAVAVGLWTLRLWAFWAVVVVEVIRVLLGLYDILIVREAVIAGIVSLIIPVIILIYLFADRNVRAAFRPAEA